MVYPLPTISSNRSVTDGITSPRNVDRLPLENVETHTHVYESKTLFQFERLLVDKEVL